MLSWKQVLPTAVSQSRGFPCRRPASWPIPVSLREGVLKSRHNSRDLELPERSTQSRVQFDGLPDQSSPIGSVNDWRCDDRPSCRDDAGPRFHSMLSA
jgi:hypothetical protein